ncbi:hypothetical protein IAT40_000238 [Kwoniella sp. CBS 6097]
MSDNTNTTQASKALSAAMRVWMIPGLRDNILSFLPQKEKVRLLRVSSTHWETLVPTIYREFPYKHLKRLQNTCRYEPHLQVYLRSVQAVELDQGLRIDHAWDEWPDHFTPFSQASTITDRLHTLTRQVNDGKTHYHLNYLRTADILVDPYGGLHYRNSMWTVPESWNSHKRVDLRVIDDSRYPSTDLDLRRQELCQRILKWLGMESTSRCLQALQIEGFTENKTWLDLCEMLVKSDRLRLESIDMDAVDQIAISIIILSAKTLRFIRLQPWVESDMTNKRLVLSLVELLGGIPWHAFIKLENISVTCTRRSTSPQDLAGLPSFWSNLSSQPLPRLKRFQLRVSYNTQILGRFDESKELVCVQGVCRTLASLVCESRRAVIQVNIAENLADPMERLVNSAFEKGDINLNTRILKGCFTRTCHFDAFVKDQW